MNQLKVGILLLSFSTLAACGRQVVEFKIDGGPDAGTADVKTDRGADTKPDTGGDVGADLGGDASADLGTDTTTDRAADTATDRAADTATDRGADANPTDARDAAADAALDGAQDAAGDADTDASLNQAPMVISTLPMNGALAPVGTSLSATFDKAMDPTSLSVTTFTVKQGVNAVVGVVTYAVATRTATFNPATPLGLGLLYTATITTGARDTGGLALAAPYTWSFTTAACSQAPVVLGSAGDFVVLAGSTVTGTGLTSVTGDLGVSPGTAITGFPPGVVVGTQHAGDPTAAQGIADLTTAYNDAAGRTLCPVSVAGNLGGQTLAPGLYKSTSSLEVSSGDLTLDAQGDGNAVFIFQMATTLTTTAGRLVLLTNGAKSTNVYWQVGTSATLGTTSAFQGTIMADQSITLNTGATLNGRALAHIAAVNLDTNVIVKPAP